MSNIIVKNILENYSNGKSNYIETLRAIENYVDLVNTDKDRRDKFAMAALSGLTAKFGSVDTAKRAYEIADVMMKERIK